MGTSVCDATIASVSGSGMCQASVWARDTLPLRFGSQLWFFYLFLFLFLAVLGPRCSEGFLLLK